MGSPVKKLYQNTTVRLPKPIYDRAKWLVEKKQTEASSLNEFVVEAVREKLSDMCEADIDAAFAQMSTDPDYQREAVSLAREFAVSDWEAFQLGMEDKHERFASETETARETATTKSSSR